MKQNILYIYYSYCQKQYSHRLKQVEEVAWLPDMNPTWASQQQEEKDLRRITQHTKWKGADEMEGRECLRGAERSRDVALNLMKPWNMPE